jgi:hypothetical protein
VQRYVSDAFNEETVTTVGAGFSNKRMYASMELPSSGLFSFVLALRFRVMDDVKVKLQIWVPFTLFLPFCSSLVPLF